MGCHEFCQERKTEVEAWGEGTELIENSEDDIGWQSLGRGLQLARIE